MIAPPLESELSFMCIGFSPINDVHARWWPPPLERLVPPGKFSGYTHDRSEPIVTSENEVLVNQESTLQGSELKKPIEDVGENKVRYDTKVYVTAEFINQECQLDETDIKSLKNVLRSRDHLCRNVISITYGPVQTYREKSGLFKHYMQFIMDVDVSQLWENPRSYIYHHLGRDTWTFSNGTNLELRRIHQKQH